ncbi:hypothetical protein LK468_16900 [Mycobacteroides abscessus]|uniref:hypothetical protein n=1 Tax=Mycobacteroides abscessus TaxID=36809 RepID=UPI0005E0FC2E|nr:hypothetical protein [Mycobacteroides abscessus]MDO3300429.1 hypothetical protein [Mycobacteroides abscessus subsp. massiliense]UEA47894.1 hypothetical protein LK451_19325 [Mycobacteroides abscessus subsp. abscessus]UEA52125.1 hypothetical protein LK468_16900 [Mycobacteroides abscessus]CPW81524.1 Uncharacterised protein [Mycobacteroides abscessus]SKE36055.1 Uncharacterised protein [Mycobacteroides abscessus subsp. bolletii]
MTKYDYAGMQACVDDVDKAINEVQSVLDDLQSIVDGIEASVKTDKVTDAMTAVYKQAFRGIDDEVLTPLREQKKYVEDCMEEARAGDAALAGGWG